MSADTSDEFQKELVELFVQEAREWLQNIHVALDELQQGPAPERHAALIEILTGGVTNLGGSAATINLPEVEQASFAALPFIEALRDPTRSFSVQDFLSLCKQLGQIHASLMRTTGVSFEEAADESAAAGAVQASISPMEFAQALRTLKSHPSAVDRGLITALIAQMESQIQAGVQQLGIDVIKGYLERMSESEDAFIRSVDTCLPELIQRIPALAQAPAPEAWAGPLEAVALLRADAQQVNAMPVMTFLSGLHGLLVVVTQHRLSLALPRTEAIALKLRAMIDLIHQWGEGGRAERAAVWQIIPAS